MIPNLPEFERETTVRVGDHEILLSFLDDDDALVFAEWWAVCGGQEAYLEWIASKVGQQAIKAVLS